MKVVLLAVLVVTMALTGCSSNRDQERQARGSAEQMYQQAQGHINTGNFSMAAQTLRNIESRFPFGAHINQVQLDLIYVYYQVGDQDRALTAIDRFLRLNPNHADIDYVRYMRGLVHLQLEYNAFHNLVGLDRADRDKTYAEQAFEDFRQLLERFPNSEYASDARARMVGIQSRLAQYELAVGEYYLRREAYMAAATRGQYILENYAQAPEVQDALVLMIQAYDAIGVDDLRDDAQAVLRLNFPQHRMAR
ncbi:outer membrane protein assembly factor BamD [Aliidiomarina maris]|uniref:Outer membrane protein assembly factor BamD n=1 Tax=Aliidiomarina maris TaxID=531312 RepID=A0A327WTM6_9GAMM|nr:outer membrane protein assembly factor BamD [Aliidiomarina maris]RAJ94602.1 Beta-barrel assembly machine subunit BamD [Aliidiomarina maris]RUO19707.1 outer membrane protein assembly factor BamD [Aliidiomarina maris]